MSKKIKLAVIGGRDFDDKEKLFKILDKNRTIIGAIVSGGAQGADQLAQDWAKERGFPCIIFYPMWHDEHGVYDKGAGFRRNWRIVQTADSVLAFWDGESKGTANSIKISNELGKPLKIIKYARKRTEETVSEPNS